MPVPRHEVFAQISEERAQQDLKYPDDDVKTVGDWLVLTQVYLTEGFRCLSREGDVGALHELRRIAAIVVTCLEYHGHKIGIGADPIPAPEKPELDPLDPDFQG